MGFEDNGGAIVSITPVPAEQISNADYYAGGLWKSDPNRPAKPALNIPAMRARVEDDAEGISYALQAEVGNLANKTASVNKAISRIANAKAAFMDLTSSPAPRGAIQTAAKYFAQHCSDAADLIWDTEPAEVL